MAGLRWRNWQLANPSHPIIGFPFEMHDRQDKNLIVDCGIDDSVWKCFDQEAPDIAAKASPCRRTSLDLSKARLYGVNKSRSKPGVLFLVIERGGAKLFLRFRVKNHARFFSVSLICRNASSAGIPLTLSSRKSCSLRSSSARIASSTR